MKKLLVLYKPKELNVNAMVYAFNDVCDSLDCKEYKFTRIENCTYDKPVKWFYSYIFYVSENLNIKIDDFIERMINNINYSHIKRDDEWILEKLEKLNQNYEICICTNNHKRHLDKVLKAKFGIMSNNFPYPILDVTYVENLEKHFNIKSSDFLWIDDTPTVLEKISEFWWNCILINENNSLIEVLGALHN